MSQTNGVSPEALRETIKQQTESSLSDLKTIRNLLFLDGSMDFHLTTIQRDELSSVSLGQSAEERSRSIGNTQNTVYNRRWRLTRAMGAKTLPNAVWLGIASGDLQIDLRDPDKPPFEISTEHSEVILHAAAGERSKGISNAMDIPPAEIDSLFNEARDLLGAKNRSHLVRRACEERVLARQAVTSADISIDDLARMNDALLIAQPLLSEAAGLIRPEAEA